jgi:hypothetical protein
MAFAFFLFINSFPKEGFVDQLGTTDAGILSGLMPDENLIFAICLSYFLVVILFSALTINVALEDTELRNREEKSFKKSALTIFIAAQRTVLTYIQVFLTICSIDFSKD